MNPPPGTLTFEQACIRGRQEFDQRKLVNLVDLAYCLHRWKDGRGRAWQPASDYLTGWPLARLSEALARLDLPVEVSPAWDHASLLTLRDELSHRSPSPTAQEAAWVAVNLAHALDTVMFIRDWLPTLVPTALRRAATAALAGTAGPEEFLRLGPLGTALASADKPRVLLIDEIDKSDIDLPSDLLDVLERGEFEIDILKRHARSPVPVRLDGNLGICAIHDGTVRRGEFPVIVMTSNGEREFPPPFLRRCIRFPMPDPDAGMLARIVDTYLGELDDDVRAGVNDLLTAFAKRLERKEVLATDQLLNAVYLVTRQLAPEGDQRRRLEKLLTKDLSTA